MPTVRPSSQHRVDDLFADRKLGFAHFDVEGEELNVLHGAKAVIARDRPIFTTEVHVHFEPQLTRELIRFGTHRRYRSFMVEGDAGGTCGVRLDCRNVISVPHERTRALVALDRYVERKNLVPVNDSSVLHFAHPCCAPGGLCCPKGPVPVHLSWTAQNHGVSCCMPKVVLPVYKRHPQLQYSADKVRGEAALAQH